MNLQKSNLFVHSMRQYWSIPTSFTKVFRAINYKFIIKCQSFTSARYRGHFKNPFCKMKKQKAISIKRHEQKEKWFFHRNIMRSWKGLIAQMRVLLMMAGTIQMQFVLNRYYCYLLIVQQTKIFNIIIRFEKMFLIFLQLLSNPSCLHVFPIFYRPFCLLIALIFF